MSETKQSNRLPRRTLLAGAGLAFAVPLMGTKVQARSLGTVMVTISGKGNSFKHVVAHFPLEGGGTAPFYAWSKRSHKISFPMTLTAEGLRLTVGGDKPEELTLRTKGTHVLTRESGASELRITVTPV